MSYKVKTKNLNLIKNSDLHCHDKKKAFFVHSNFTDGSLSLSLASCPSGQYIPVVIKIVYKELRTAIA